MLVVPEGWGNATVAYTAEFRTDWLKILLWVWGPASNVH